MAFRVAPERRRLSLSQSDPANSSKARDFNANLVDRLDLSGLLVILDAERLQGKKGVSITSVTDEDLKRRKEFTEKDVEVLFPPGSNQDELISWVEAQGVAWSCRKGLKPESPNQDSFSVLMVEDEFSLYCVYDGHGPSGHDVSDIVRENLVRMFVGSEHRAQNPKKAFEESFVKCQSCIEELQDLDASMSGTTCTMAYHDLRSDRVWIAHVGDSRAVLGKSKKGSQAPPLADDLTVDHKPNLESEKKRIESSNPPGRVVFDGFYNHRVFAMNGMYPGLNMSRAIGDVVGHKEAGLSAEPDVTCVDLRKVSEENPDHPELTLILCTDGVWEFIESPQAVAIAVDPAHESSKAATDQLAKESWDRWMQDSDNEISDDITAIMVRLRRSKA